MLRSSSCHFVIIMPPEPLSVSLHVSSALFFTVCVCLSLSYACVDLTLFYSSLRGWQMFLSVFRHLSKMSPPLRALSIFLVTSLSPSKCPLKEMTTTTFTAYFCPLPQNKFTHASRLPTVGGQNDMRVPDMCRTVRFRINCVDIQ